MDHYKILQNACCFSNIISSFCKFPQRALPKTPANVKHIHRIYTSEICTIELMSTKLFSDLEVLAEMVTKAPTRVAIVEPCLGEPKDFEVGGISF